MLRRNNLWLWASLIFLATAYVGTNLRLGERPRQSVAPELLVALPRLAQVAVFAGDRYLAANLAGFRVLVASTSKMNAADYAVEARLQEDIAWFNPAHEDNYYIAAAILPWNGQVGAAQFVLGRAGDARPFDWTPLFYQAFNLYHFVGDLPSAAGRLIKAADRAQTPQERWALQNLAARWLEKGYETRVAANLVDAMAKGTPDRSFQRYLQARAARLRDLARLRELAERYREKFGHPLARLEDLVAAGLIDTLPVDPLDLGYDLTGGTPTLRITPAEIK